MLSENRQQGRSCNLLPLKVAAVGLAWFVVEGQIGAAEPTAGEKDAPDAKAEGDEASIDGPLVCPDGTSRKVESKTSRGIVSSYDVVEEWCEGKEGRKDGPFRTIGRNSLRKDPDIVQGSYKDGLREGSWVEWFNGHKSREGTYRNDKEDGPWTVWHWVWDRGTVEKQQYRNGRKSGVWKKWRIPGSEDRAETTDYGSGEPYIRPCTPKAVTWEGLQKETGAPALQTVGNPWLDCHRLGSGRSAEMHCTQRTAPAVGTWCAFVHETLCDSDEGRWRNPDDCGVEDVELAGLDQTHCPDFVATNSKSKRAKPALRVPKSPTCGGVFPRSPPGCRRTYDPLAHTYLLHCNSAGGR